MAPAFDVNTQVIGVPAIIISGMGLIVAGAFIFKITQAPDQITENGDPERKVMNAKLRKLQQAIANGAYAFLLKEYTYLLIATLSLFVLVSAAVNWRTGLWLVIIILTFLF